MYYCPGLDLSCFCTGLKHCLFAPSFRAVMLCTQSVRFTELNPAPCWGWVPCTCEHCTFFSTMIQITLTGKLGFWFHAGKTSSEEESSPMTLHLKVSNIHYFPLTMFSWEELWMINTSVLSNFWVWIPSFRKPELRAYSISLILQSTGYMWSIYSSSTNIFCNPIESGLHLSTARGTHLDSHGISWGK